MTAEEALKLKRKGQKLYEEIIFDPRITVPKEKVVVIHLPATNPFPEDGK